MKRISVLDSSRRLTYSEHPKTDVPPSPAIPDLTIRELESIADLRRAIQLEKQVWSLDDADATSLTAAVAEQASGALWLGAFEREDMVGIAYAFPSLHEG